MSKHDIKFLTEQTHRLEALGFVLGSTNEEYLTGSAEPTRPRSRPGRKRVYQSNAKRQRAYRYRAKSQTVTK